MRGISVLRNIALALIFFLALSAPAFAQAVGGIGGTVSDPSGAVLPGVTLTVTSPGLIGSGQSTVSDGQGHYQFLNLVPGTYSVKAELPGFQTIVQEKIAVNSDRTSRADLKLAVGDVAETVTVSGVAPLLDTTSALKQTVMSRTVIDSVPAGADVWSIARLVPAVQQTVLEWAAATCPIRHDARAREHLERAGADRRLRHHGAPGIGAPGETDTYSAAGSTFRRARRRRSFRRAAS